MSHAGDILNRKHLNVLNRSAPAGQNEFFLEDRITSNEGFSVPPSELKGRVVEALRQVYDPEIPLNIYDLGLIYGVIVGESGEVKIEMTVTSPGCPVAGVLLRHAHLKVCKVAGVRHVKTELVWEPPWTRERMSEAARLALGLL